MSEIELNGALDHYKIQMNASLTTTESKKAHPSRLVAGAQMQNGQVPHPCG